MKKKLSKKKRSPSRPAKVYGLALGTGYAEDASWSQLIMISSDGGFDCVQDALINMHYCIRELCTQEIKWAAEYNISLDRMHSTQERRVTDIDPTDLIEDTLRTIIHGTYQDHGDFWELAADAGWQVGPAWNNHLIKKHGLTQVDCAPKMIHESVSWDESPIKEYDSRWYAREYMHHRPKGTLVFRAELVHPPL